MVKNFVMKLLHGAGQDSKNVTKKRQSYVGGPIRSRLSKRFNWSKIDNEIVYKFVNISLISLY